MKITPLMNLLEYTNKLTQGYDNPVNICLRKLGKEAEARMMS
jgi:hypothetical protein